VGGGQAQCGKRAYEHLPPPLTPCLNLRPLSLTHTPWPPPLPLQASKAIKEECEAILAEAMPALEAAIAALATIKQVGVGLVRRVRWMQVPTW